MRSPGLLRKARLALLIVVALGLSAIFSPAHAKLASVELMQLVEESTFIAYGKTQKVDRETLGKRGYVVRFKPEVILKNTQNEHWELVPLCNDLDDVESYDLRTYKEPYIIFASKQHAPCLFPVWGMYSVIATEGGQALTSSIYGQPKKQALSTFMDKIRTLVDETK